MEFFKFCLAAALAVCVVSVPVLDSSDAYLQQRQKFVDEINATPGITWHARVNSRFAGMPIGGSKDMCGVKPGSKARLLDGVRAGKIGFVPAQANLNIPESFDSEANWPQCAKVIGDIRDQSNCGCCWAFAAASSASDRMCIATNATISLALSAEDMCFCGSDDGCGGGMLDEAWDYILQSGLVTGGQYPGDKTVDPFNADGLCSAFSLPHCHHHGPQGSDPYPAEGAPGCASQSSPACPTKCDGTAQAPHSDFAADKYSFAGSVQVYDSDADTIAAGIMKDGPAEAAFTVYADFENYAGGIYSHTSGEQVGGHAIRIVGWGVENGVKYWKVANSWNPFWGEKGYFRIKRGTNECGIEEQVTASSSGAKWAKKSQL